MLIGVKDSQSDLEKHYKTFCGLYKIKAFRAQFRGVRDRAFSYIDLLNYMLKYKIPQIVTLTLGLHQSRQIAVYTKEKNSYLFLDNCLIFK